MRLSMRKSYVIVFSVVILFVMTTPFAVWAKGAAGQEPGDLCDPCYNSDFKKDPPAWNGTGYIVRDVAGNVYVDATLQKSGKNDCYADLVFPLAVGVSQEEFRSLKPGDLKGRCFNEKTAGVLFECKELYSGEYVPIGRAVELVDIGMNLIPGGVTIGDVQYADAFRVHLTMMELQSTRDDTGCALEYCCPPSP